MMTAFVFFLNDSVRMIFISVLSYLDFVTFVDFAVQVYIYFGELVNIFVLIQF